MPTKKKYQKRGRKLTLSNGIKVEFDDPISQVETFGNVLVALFDEKAKPEGGSEVLAVDAKNGAILWRRNRKPGDPFTELYPFSEDTVRVFAWRGDIFDIDPKTGKLQGKYWSK